MPSVPGHLQRSSAAALWTQHLYGLSGKHEGSLLRHALPLPGLSRIFWTDHWGTEELHTDQHRRGIQGEQGRGEHFILPSNHSAE